MEGTPVRGQQKAALVQLNEVLNLENFQSEVVRLVGAEFKHAQVFFGSMDPNSGTLQLPVWVRSHLERHSGLQKKLDQGEMVGISATEDLPTPRPAVAARSSVVLIPVMNDAKLTAAIGLVSPSDEPPLSAEDVELARQFAYEISPILARLQEIEDLRREKQELLERAGRGDRAEEACAAILKEKNGLDAILQMRSHQQVNIAHELRTPLAAIRGYARMILDGRSGSITDKQREYLQVVTDNTNRLITLVAWMSYVSEMSTQHLRVSVFDFRELWSECVEKNQVRLSEKSLKLNQNIPDEPFVIVSDWEKLGMVLADIVNCAVNLAAPGSAIAMEIWHGRERELNFKLSETGAEIPADVLAKIFDRSFNTIEKPGPQNTSNVMSLSALYDIVGMHGGRVFVNNTAGKSATFLFTLPAITASAEENYEQAVNSSRRRR
jgi:signal transduction histidine kinase